MAVRSNVGDHLVIWRRETETFEPVAGAESLPTFGSPIVFTEDHSGGIWIGLRNGGLVRYRRGQFRHFANPASLLGPVAAL
jgi:hypothetical protein